MSEVEPPDGPERGITVGCPDHGEATEFEVGRRRGSFYCPGRGVELEVSLAPVRFAHENAVTATRRLSITKQKCGRSGPARI